MEHTEIIGERRETMNQEPPALFVYIPFCRTLCTYCDFNVYAHLGKLFEKYVEAVVLEIERAGANIPAPRRARSLAFGGGTPSILATHLIERVVKTARENFDLEPGAEITLEANPGTVDLGKLRMLRNSGVDRLSLGIQTFDDTQLKAFNRNHNSAQSREAFEQARRAGFENINLDLIFGLPAQTLEQWGETVVRAIEWGPEHLSLYGLQIEDGTALARQIARGRVQEPDPDLAADMFLLADEKLSAAGYEHYEISNYARPGHQSRHNLTYWLNEPYLGFGAGAHSSWQGRRYSNLLNPGEYIARIERGVAAIDSAVVITRELEIGETLMLGLRLEQGISFDRFRARFGEDVRELHRETIAQLKDWGLMEIDGERMRLTTRGRLVSNQVLWRFLPDSEPT